MNVEAEWRKVGLLALVVACGSCAMADDWRDMMWESPVALCNGVTLRAYALEEPRLMKAYVARIDLTAPGIGFTATERDPDWGQSVAVGSNKAVCVGLSAKRQETTADFMLRRRKEGKKVELAVNTSGWGPMKHKPGDLYRWAVSDGVELSYNKNPSRGYFFIVRKDGTADMVAHPPASITNEIAFAMYGNGFILKNGAEAFPTNNAKFTCLAPRTAFGLVADKKTLVILAVDGRQPGYSLGASYADLAELFRREGCTDAINFDGGGSTSFVVWDRKNNHPDMLNRHPDGYVRKIALNFGITVDETAVACRDRLELERTGSIFHSYEFAPVEDTPPPDGFVPFYISHYGRHGSRRLMGNCVSHTLSVLEEASKNGMLTNEGNSLLDAVRRIADASVGMEGQLTERGAEEHRMLARRMAERFAPVFRGRRRVRCQSTDVHRVLVSQANFAMSLKESAPDMEFDFTAGPKYTKKLKHSFRRPNGAKGGASEAKERFDRAGIKTGDFVARMFTKTDAVDAPLSLMRDLFACASDCQCLRTELGGLDIYRYFTGDEIDALSRCMAAWHYMAQGNSPDFGDDRAWAAQGLARDFVERADNAIADGRVAADLRFGHDTGLAPLAVLLGLEGPSDRVSPRDARELCPGWKWMPMAANIQMAFYRNKDGETLVKILYNEREIIVRGLSPATATYYRWHDLRAHILAVVENLSLRLDSIATIREEHAKLSKPVFLTGDWNAAPHSELVTKVRGFLNDVNRPTNGAQSRCIDYIAIDSAHADKMPVMGRHVTH